MKTATNSSGGASRFRVLISVVLIVLLLTAGGVSSAFLASLREAPVVREPEPRRYNVEIFRVETADIQEMVSAFGTARADKEVILGAQVAGEIVEVHPQLKVGARVHAPRVVSSGTGESVPNPGDVLVRIDPRSYDERVVQVEARIEEAKAELRRLDQEERNVQRLTDQLEKDLADLEREYSKVVDLASRKIATDSDVRRAQLEVRVAETKLVQNLNELELMPSRREQVVRRMATLQNDLEIARLDQQRTIIHPPFDGRLSEVFVEEGQYVKPGDPLVRLADATVVEVPVAVSMTDYAKLVPFIRAGRSPATDLAENETAPARWHGELVRASPEADERTRTVTLYVRVDNMLQETPLLPGTFVHARISGPVLQNVLAVPRDAVLNGRGFVLQDGHAVRRDVQLSRTLHTLAIISTGFAPGDEVILSNLDVLYDGAPVAPRDARSVAEELDRQAIPLARLVTRQPH